MTHGIGQALMEQTQYQYLQPSDQNKGLPQPPLELAHDPAQALIDLPAPADLPDYPLDLRTAIEQRRSVREYAEEPLSLEELSFLLWCTQGVKETRDSYATLRTAPSAGARHAFETYLLVNNVEGLRPGLYRFLALTHKLVELKLDGDLAGPLTAACLEQPYVKTSAVTFFWVAVVYRMAWRYGERGYRYLHMDAGHVCQNLYLAAEALDVGVCAIGAFHDQDLNDLLDLNGEERFVIYLATVGKKEPSP